MKNLFIFAALALGVATLNSCTQEDTTEVPVESRMKPASNMRELTEQLKAYDARFVRNEEMPLRVPGGVKFNKLDYAKIADQPMVVSDFMASYRRLPDLLKAQNQNDEQTEAFLKAIDWKK